jgi:hypothetical protein
MKNENQKPKEGAGDLKVCEISRLIVEPITSQLREQSVWSLEQSNEILNRLEKIEDSMEIIARQLYRDTEGEER